MLKRIIEWRKHQKKDTCPSHVRTGGHPASLDSGALLATGVQNAVAEEMSAMSEQEQRVPTVAPHACDAVHLPQP